MHLRATSGFDVGKNETVFNTVNRIVYPLSDFKQRNYRNMRVKKCGCICLSTTRHTMCEEAWVEYIHVETLQRLYLCPRDYNIVANSNEVASG